MKVGDLVELSHTRGLVWRIDKLREEFPPWSTKMILADLTYIGRLKRAEAAPTLICQHERGVSIFALRKVPPLLVLAIQAEE
jgi:hypothetical protein